MNSILLAVALALPAAAQNVDFAKMGKEATAVQAALVAMNDGNPMGMKVADAIRQSGAMVAFEPMGGRSTIRIGKDGTPIIVLDSALAKTPRVLGPRIAREASKMLLTGMPESAEKLYMARSIEVRVWLELGGEPRDLPVIDATSGAKDAAMASEFKQWLDEKPEMLLYKLGQAAGVDDIPTQQEALRVRLQTTFSTPELISERRRQLGALETANRAFVQFLLEEKEWKEANGC